MKNNPEQLREDLDQVLHLLEHDSIVPFSGEQRAGLLVETERLFERLRDAADQVLTIGLLGGTGVGKSTVMNALAGAEIAAVSHRRPHTDRVLIYRHEEAELPAPLAENPTDHIEHRHRVDAAARLLLCDLPDFDSLIGEHRSRVAAFLSELDLLIWVSSPEKYADRKFYQLLVEVPKARRNCIFVLNKADLLFADRPAEDGYSDLQSLLAQFRAHLAAVGIEHPVLYGVSAEQFRTGVEPAPWNQFPALREQVLRQRDAKEIAAIKTANLDLEVRRLTRAVAQELRRLESFHEVLANLRRDFATVAAEGRSDGHRAIAEGLGGGLIERVAARLNDDSVLLGAGRGWFYLSRYWRLKIEQPEGSGAAFEVPAAESLVAVFRRRWAALVTGAQHSLLQHDVPEPLTAPLHRILDPNATGKRLDEAIQRTLAERLRGLTPLPRPGFRALQRLSNTLLVAVFLISVGGTDNWLRFLAAPEPVEWLRLGAALVTALFGPNGPAALGTLLALHLLLALRFHHSHKKFLRRRAQKTIESVGADLVALWDQAWEAPAAELERLSTELERRLAEASALEAREKGR